MNTVRVSVKAPRSLMRLCEVWADDLGCEPEHCLLSVLSCGVGYLLSSHIGYKGLRDYAVPALHDLAHMAPEGMPTTWYEVDLEEGTIHVQEPEQH